MKRILTILLILIAFSIQNSSGQTLDWKWAKKAGKAKGERANAVTTDISGNILVCGEFQSASVQAPNGFNLGNSGYGSDIFLIKFFNNANPPWARSFGGIDHDVPTDICIDTIGNYYITGYFFSPELKFDSVTLINSSTAHSDLFLTKIDAYGNVQWGISAGGNGNEQAREISINGSGNIYLCGTFTSDSIVLGSEILYNLNPGTSDLFISRLDPNGNFIWSIKAGGSDDDEVTSISTTANGETYVSGNFKSSSITLGSTTLQNAGGSDLFVSKLDVNGNFLWSISAGGIEQDSAHTLSIDGQGNIYLAGGFNSDSISFSGNSLHNSGTATSDAFITKFDPNGSLLWSKSISGLNNETAVSISSDYNGNICVSGMFTSPIVSIDSATLSNVSGTPDIFIVKYNPAGTLQWGKKAGGTLTDNSTDIIMEPSGGIYTTGYFLSPELNFGSFQMPNVGNSTPFIVYYTSNGISQLSNPLLYPQFYDDRPSDIVTDQSGNTYVTGMFKSSSIHFDSLEMKNSKTGDDLFIVKYDSTGNVLWTQGAIGKSWEYGSSLCTDPEDNLYAAGYGSDTITIGQVMLPGNGQTRFFITKIDKNGNILWAKEYGSHAVATDICSDMNGNIYVAGSFNGDSIVFGSFTLFNTVYPNYSDIFILKLDSAGNVIWAQSAGGNEFEYTYGIAVDQSKNVYVTGSFMSDSIHFGSNIYYNNGYLDLFIAKLDSNGNFLWADVAGGQYGDVSNEVITDTEGNAYITGYFSSATIDFGSTTLSNPTVNTKEIFLVKYKSDGSVSWAQRYGGSDNDEASDIVLDEYGNIYQTGNFASSTILFGSYLLHRFGTAQDIFITKYDSAGNVIYAERAGGTYIDISTSISSNQNGTISITGYFGSPNLQIGPDTLSGVEGYNIFCGTFNGSLINDVKQLAIDNEINIFPNPFSTFTTLKSKKFLNDASIVLFNSWGQIITRINHITGNEVKIYLDDLSSGLYFVQLIEDNKILTTKKVVISD